MTDLLLVGHHHGDDNPHRLTEWAALRGVSYKYVRAGGEDGNLTDSLSHAGFDAVVVFGAESSVNDPLPWVRTELDFVRDVDAAGKPFLGICFGGQLLAKALGGEVHRLPVTEIGWYKLRSSSPLLPEGPWLMWHEDHVTPPPGADVLGRTDAAIQAYTLGRHFGLQFHPEASMELVLPWIEIGGNDYERWRERPRADFVAETAAHVPQAAEYTFELFDNWFKHAGLG